VLDAPGELLFARKGEHSVPVLEELRRGYVQLATRFPRSLVIDAAQPPQRVARAALTAVWLNFSDTGAVQHPDVRDKTSARARA
jgi:hypothetical protein